MVALLDSIGWPRKLFYREHVVCSSYMLQYVDLVVVLEGSLSREEGYEVVADVVGPACAILLHTLLCLQPHEDFLDPTHGLSAGEVGSVVFGGQHGGLEI